MAFKFKTFAAVGALIGSLALVGCGQDEKDPNHIKVGVIVGAEQQVAEVAQKVAKDKYGLDVEMCIRDSPYGYLVTTSPQS